MPQKDDDYIIVDVPPPPSSSSRGRGAGPAPSPPAPTGRGAGAGPGPAADYEMVDLPQPNQFWQGFNAWAAQVNPLPIVNAVGKALIPAAVGERLGLEDTGPQRFLEQIGAAQGQAYDRAWDAYNRGDYLGAVLHGGAYLVPMMGPAVSQAAEDMRQGRTGQGIGTALGIGTMLGGPAGLAEAGANIKVPAILRTRLNPKEAAAVAFGEREGIPIDAATATGNKAVQGAQHLAARSVIGSRIAEPFMDAQSEALSNTASRLSQRAAPGATPNPETSGRGVMSMTQGRANLADQLADVAYDELRALEAQRAQVIQQHGGVQAPATHAKPFTAEPFAVDLNHARQALKPIYDALRKEHETVPFTSGSAQGKALVTLQTLMDAPDL